MSRAKQRRGWSEELRQAYDDAVEMLRLGDYAYEDGSEKGARLFGLMLKDIDRRLERIHEATQEREGNEYVSNRILGVIGSAVRDEGGFGGTGAGEDVTYTQLGAAEALVKASKDFLKNARTLKADIRKHRKETSVDPEDVLSNEEWEEWISNRAEELGIDSKIFARPVGARTQAMEVNALQARLDEVTADLKEESDTAKQYVLDIKTVQTENRKAQRLLKGGLKANELGQFLSEEGVREFDELFADGVEDEAPAVAKLLRREIDVEKERFEERAIEQETLPSFVAEREGIDTEPSERREPREEAQAVPEMEAAAIEAQQAADLEEAAIEQERALAEDFAVAEFDVGGEARGDEPLDPDGRKGIDDDTRQYIIDNFSMAGFLLKLTDGSLAAMAEVPPGSGNMVKVDNVMAYIDEHGLTDENQIRGLFLQTDWYNNTEPELKEWQQIWYAEGGEGFQTFAESNANQRALLDDKMDSIKRMGEKLGLNLDEEALWKLAYEAQSMGFDTYEIREQFTSTYKDALFASDEGSFEVTRNDIRDEAADYMMTWTDEDLDDAAKRVYLGQTTVKEIEAGIRNEAKAENPALASLIDQGYTPKMYFASYKKEAENLLERKVDFLGGDRGLYDQLTGTEWDTEGARPMTRAEFGRTLRGTPEWQYTDNARDSAYDAASQIARMFGAIG